MNTNDIRKEIQELFENNQKGRPMVSFLKSKALALIPKNMELVGKEWADEANKIGKMLQKDHVIVPKKELEQLKRERGFWEKEHQRIACFCMLDCQPFHKKNCGCKGCKVANMTVDWKVLSAKEKKT